MRPLITRLFPVACFMLGVVFGAGIMACGPDSDPGTPQACIDALDEAEEVIDVARQGFVVVQEIFEAISVLDLDRVEDGASKLEQKIKPLETATDAYIASAEECRG